jgi:hypothetical protein
MFVGSILLAVWLLLRARRATLVPYLGLALVGFAIAGPALWPWYLSWGVVLLAAWVPAQRSWGMVLALIVGSLLVKPGGILALPLGSSPVVACLWLAFVALLWYRWRRRQRLNSPGARTESLAPTRSVLVER